MKRFCSAPEVIELLEVYLKAAKERPFGHVAIAMVGYPDIACIDWAGDIDLERASHEALGVLHGGIAGSIANWTLPPRDESLDASYVCYNVANGPLGFDFLLWLINAEMTRIRSGAPAPLKVGFWLGLDKDDRMNRDQRRMWLENVFRPLLPMLGAVEDERALKGRSHEDYVLRDLVDAVRAGEKAPILKSPISCPEKGHVTITLREKAGDKIRNSNLNSWIRFANWLKNAGENVIIVRDTECANIPLAGLRIEPKASFDLQYRMALYESAKTNLFVENGPIGLAFFGEFPWISFFKVDDDSEFVRTTAFWDTCYHMKPGDQLPWSRKDQRIVWQADTYENLVSAWEQTTGA
jgi:hypothetical protein